MIAERLHELFMKRRRSRRIAELVSERLHAGSTVLDVGCGDGELGLLVAKNRPVTVVGLEAQRRLQCAIPVALFDGERIPVTSKAVDYVLLIDVLHHARDPQRLIVECARVARRGILIKDHLADAMLARPRLRLMDRIGNQRFDVPSPGSYWTAAEWREVLDACGLRVMAWQERLALYPWPLRPLIEWRLHVLLVASPT